MILPGEYVAKFLESGIKKINPTGVDVIPKKVFRIPEYEIIIDGSKRGFLVGENFVEIREGLIEVKPEGEYYRLSPGVYYVVFPRIKIPPEVTGFAFPRSTFNRLGIIKSQTAVFDPGYEGEWNQTFLFLTKAKIHVNEAWVQVVFIKNAEIPKELYQGYWHGERY